MTEPSDWQGVLLQLPVVGLFLWAFKHFMDTGLRFLETQNQSFQKSLDKNSQAIDKLSENLMHAQLRVRREPLPPRSEQQVPID